MIQKKKSSPVSKLLLSFGLIFASSAYALWQNMRSEARLSGEITPGQSYREANQALLQTITNLGAQTTPASTSTPVPPMMGSGMMNRMRGLYADGSYTGNSFDAYYGMVQVKVLVVSNKITDVQFLQYPNNRSNSRMINNQAMPLLTEEAIQAQSAQVNGVSGATFTSDAFQKSLASALVLAKTK